MNQAMRRKQKFEARRTRLQTNPVSRYFLDAYLENLDEPPALRESRALLAFWGNCHKPVFADEPIVGTLVQQEPAGFFYGSGTWINPELAERYSREQQLDSQAREKFQAELDRVDQHRYHAADQQIFTCAQQASIAAHAATSTWFGGHMVLDFSGLINRGFAFYADWISRAEASCQQPEPGFFEAMRTMLAAIDTYIAGYAEAVLPGQPDLAADLDWIRRQPPVTFRQGLQLVWLVHLLNGADSFGRFDQYLWPLLQQDLAQQRLTEAEAYDLLLAFWIKIEEADAIQNMTIGGCDRQGRPAYNLLTRLCLKATEELAYKGPNLCLRVWESLPEPVFTAALACLDRGLGLPALYNDAVYIENLLRSGIEPEEARDYCLAGCSQVMIPGKSQFYNDVGLYNAGKILELTWHGGFDHRTGRQVGLETRPARQMTEMAELRQAWQEQAEYFCQVEVDIHERERRYRAEREGYALRSLLTCGCLDQGRSVFSGGASYNHTQLEIIGLTNVADSLAAVNQVVFEQGYCTMQELDQALQADFAGFENLQQKLLAAPKFGNDDPAVDSIRSQITDHLYRWFNQAPSGLGGFYVPGEVIFTAHDQAGRVTGATPDGRQAGQVLADSAGASQGMDRQGPTALINSMLTLPVRKHLITSAVLNIRFLAALFHEPAARTQIRHLLQAYWQAGGGQVQINVLDPSVLQAARKNPGQYRSLVVRVGGYSEYFVNLSPALQEELISRTAHVAS